MAKKIKQLVYPFTFEEWINHASTIPKLKWCKKVGAEIDAKRKYGNQQTLQLWTK